MARFAFFIGVMMGTLRADFKAFLTGDSILMALLTGGVTDAEDRPQDGGGQSSAPRAADNVTILPHAVIRWGQSDEYAPIQIGAEFQTVEIYVYQDIGYATIDAAVSRMKALLNQRYIVVDDRQFVHLRQIHVSRELTADELGGAPCKFARYAVIQVR